MIIHSTAKLAAKLPLVEVGPLQEETNPLGSWHGNLLIIDRRQCVIFCHDRSRLALFAAGLKKDDFAEMGLLHRRLFFDYLKAQSEPAIQLKKVELALGPIGAGVGPR